MWKEKQLERGDHSGITPTRSTRWKYSNSLCATGYHAPTRAAETTFIVRSRAAQHVRDRGPLLVVRVLADVGLRLALEVPLERGLLLAADALLPLAHALHEDARLLDIRVEDEVPALGEGRVRVGVRGEVGVGGEVGVRVRDRVQLRLRLGLPRR